MIDFSTLPGSHTWVGKLLRLPLRIVPDGTVLPILQGRLRGKKWIAGSSIHSCWLGSYELEAQQLVIQTVRPGMVAFDIGAHVGFYTLLLAELVGPAGQVIAFEPAPLNIHYLREHIRLNRFANVTVIEAAVADSGGFARFSESVYSSMGQLSANGQLSIRKVSLKGEP